MGDARLGVLVRQLQGIVGARRMRGSVTSAGAVGSGSGFSASSGGAGLYTVTFDKAFDSAPYVFLQTVISGGVRAPTVATATASGFTVEVRNDAGVLANAPFVFEAVA